MSGKRILFVLPNLGGGGAERVAMNIAHALQRTGWQVTMLLGDKSGEYLSMVDPSIEVHHAAAANFQQYVKALRKFLKNRDFDFCFSFKETILFALRVVRGLNRLSYKIIANLQVDIEAYINTLPRINRSWLTMANKMASKSDIIIAASEGVKKSFVKLTGCKEGKISVIYNAIGDPEDFKTTGTPTDISVQDKKIFINVGRITPQKDQHTLISAFKLVYERYPDSLLLIVGKGDSVLELELKSLVSSLDLNSAVKFLGFKQDVYNYYAISHVFVLSSIFEGFGNVIPEAMNFGLTVVSTNCPSGPAEILANGKFGYLCKVGDPEDLGNTMIKAVQQPLPEQEIKKRAAQFHTANIVAQFEKLLR